ncbi:circadian clock-controlled protein-like [Sitophilus oryzae]|uniref:Circadian clock-controlled protein-like n=1 Tax=Sitophilus oryzae TaxID=7048 RepID=A0A6J2YTT5_SITOR|nr:circadian clock-controlled protein-like [Sitophilus oryzae]
MIEWICVISVLSLVPIAKSQIDLEEHFQNCKTSSSSFDNCVKDGINDLRPFFQSGLPDYHVGSFDPFFASQVHQKRSGPFFNYKLILRNVTESGWTQSQITKFSTNPDKYHVQVTQDFPDKRLNGIYEMDGTFFGQKIKNSGSWNLALFDYSQTLTVSRKPIRGLGARYSRNAPIKVTCNIHSCKRLQLHISNLLGGRPLVENVLDKIINTAWQPGFYLLRPLINDLVGTAFTEIFQKYFQNFPFEQVFKP